MIWGWEGEGRTVEESFGSGTPIYRIRYLPSVELGLLVGWGPAVAACRVSTDDPTSDDSTTIRGKSNSCGNT